MSENLIETSIDAILSNSPLGSLDKSLSRNLYGLDPLQSRSALPANDDTQGFLFVTRPQLNMQKDNLRNFAPMYGLLNDNPNSAGLAVRSLLDPRIGAGYRYLSPGAADGVGYIPPTPCNLINNELAFFPFFTNNVISCTGWEDKTLPTTTSDPGLYKQVYVYTDGISRDYQDRDITITIQNMKGDLSVAVMCNWMDYISQVKEEKMSPYFDYLMNNRCDHQTRIYRLITDKNKETVTKIMATAIALPTSAPFGMFGDFNVETPFSQQTKELSFRFKTVGTIVNDFRLVVAFNGVVRCFNPSMADDRREIDMVLVQRHYLGRFRHWVYPRINPDNLRLEWWTPVERYEAMMANNRPISYTEA